VARHTARDLRSENRFEVLHALFDLGPSSRQELARRTGRYLAAALGDLVNLLNIPKVTLTGWLPKVPAPWLVPAVRDELPHHVLPGSLPGLTVEVSEVPGNAVCLGMAAFTLEQFRARLGLVSQARTRPQSGAETAQPIG
jgi:predicted NBD/HSP70 family sugar kinase